MLKDTHGYGILEIMLGLIILTFLINTVLILQNKSLQLRNLVKPKFDLSTGELKDCQIKDIKIPKIIVCNESNFPNLQRYFFF